MPGAAGLTADDGERRHPARALPGLPQRPDDFLHRRLARGSFHHGGGNFPSPELSLTR